MLFYFIKKIYLGKSYESQNLRKTNGEHCLKIHGRKRHFRNGSNLTLARKFPLSKIRRRRHHFKVPTF